MKLVTVTVVLFVLFSLSSAVREGEKRDENEEGINGEVHDEISGILSRPSETTRGLKRNYSDIGTDTEQEASVVQISSSSSISSSIPNLNTTNSRTKTPRRSILAVQVQPFSSGPEPPLSTSSSSRATPKTNINLEAPLSIDVVLKYISSRIYDKKFLKAICDFEFVELHSNVLFEECICRGRKDFITALIEKGHTLSLNPSSPKITQTMKNSIDSKLGGKYKDFTTILFNVDPSTFIKALNENMGISCVKSPAIVTLESFLEDGGFSLDPEAIQVAAETAAEIGSFEIFNTLLHSDLMVRMIPQELIYKLFLSLTDAPTETSKEVFQFLENDRLLAPISHESFLLLAAKRNNLKLFSFLDLAKQSWGVMMFSIYTALKPDHFEFADIVGINLPKTVKGGADAFDLVKCSELMNLVVRKNRRLLFNDLSLKKINGNRLISETEMVLAYKEAFRCGNIDIISHYIMKDIRDKGIEDHLGDDLVCALRAKNYKFANFLINHYPELIYSFQNVENFERGDALQWVTASDPESVLFFSHMLFIGFNPNPLVYFRTANSSSVPLIYLLIKINNTELVKLLLNNKECTVDFHMALSYSNENNIEMIQLLREHFKKD